jgi:hypothetical protein
MYLQAEHLADLTNAWVMVAVHHPHAKTGFYHYASPSLRRDGGSEVTTILNQFSKLTHRMIGARRRGNLELLEQLEESNRRLAETQGELAEVRGHVDQLNERMNAALGGP